MKIEWKIDGMKATPTLLSVGGEAAVTARIRWVVDGASDVPIGWRLEVRMFRMVAWVRGIAPGAPYSDEPPTVVLEAASEWIRANVKGIATEEPQPEPPPDATREPAPGWTKIHDGHYILGDSEVTRYSDGWWPIHTTDAIDIDADTHPDLRTAQFAAEDSCVEYLRERADAYGYELRRKS